MSEPIEAWSGFLREGYFYSYLEQQVRKFFNVLYREWAHIEYTWEEDVAPYTVSGPVVLGNLETTKENQIWQVIFGISNDVYIYTHVPTDIDRHGVAKVPKQTSTLREVGHYRMKDSWWDKPSFATEHFLLKPEVPYMAFTAYNPQRITFRENYNPIKLNIYVCKCEMEQIGEESKGQLQAADGRFNETLDKLYRRVIPHRPLTLVPVRAPAKGV